MRRRFLIPACTLVAVALAVSSYAQAPKLKPGTYAHFDTSMGTFTVRLMPEQAPQTVANFVGLAEGTIDTITGRPGKSKPFYNGLTFHRVIPGFMIQGGGIQRGDSVVGAGYTVKTSGKPLNRPLQPVVIKTVTIERVQ